MIDTLQTNWAEVVNKLIDKGESAITSVITTLKESSPYVWETIQKQVMTEATVNLYVGWGFLLVSIFLLVMGILAICKDWDEVIIGICMFPAVIGIVGSSIYTIMSYKLYYLIIANPDYYTAQRIIELSKTLL